MTVESGARTVSTGARGTAARSGSVPVGPGTLSGEDTRAVKAFRACSVRMGVLACESRTGTARSEPHPAAARRAAMSHPSRRSAHSRLDRAMVLAPALAILLAACTNGAAPSTPPSTGPMASDSGGSGGTPTETPTTGTVDHKTGSRDVLLRLDEGGGFVMPAFLASQAPPFTLYGDGTVVFRNLTQEFPQPQGSVATSNPLRTAKLSEEQIQDLLVYALGEGGLGVARPNYPNDQVADASTTTFTVEAGGLKKTVSVYALGMDVPTSGVGAADAPARAAFQKLAARLTDFDQGGSIPTDAYQPSAYRGVLFESPGIVAPDVRAWPWPDLTVADFKPDADPNGLQFPHRTMSTDEVALLKVTGFEGGFQGLVLTGTDKQAYTMAIRPLLPDEDR